jgi:hypothetical protein
MCLHDVEEPGGVVAIAAHEPLYYVRIQAMLTAQATIGLEQRAALARRLAESLQALAPGQRSMAVSLLYTVAEGEAGALSQRTRTFIRWGLSFEATPTASERDQAQALLCAVFDSTQALLYAHYALEMVTSAALSAALQADPCGQPVVALGYTNMRQVSRWITPVHLQPTLDHLVSQTDCAAVQFTVERLTSDAPVGQPCLRLGIAALGAATSEGALRPLVDELRGRGILAQREPSARNVPSLRAFRAQTAAERAHIYQNLIGPAAEPWTQAPQPRLTVALTSRDIGLLLPLPMVLF